MVSTPTTLNGVTYHVNAPSFHDNLATRTHDISTFDGQAHAKTLVSLFSDAVPHMAAGGSIGTAERQLSFEVDNIIEEYSEKIRYAKESGNEDLAYILAVEQSQLEAIAEELDYTLKTLEKERDFALLEAKYDYDQGMIDNSIDETDALYDLDQDKFDSKNEFEDKLMDAQEAIDDAKADLADANSQYSSDLDGYNSSIGSATSADTFVTDAKKNSIHRQIDGWISDKLQVSSSYGDPYKYREGETPDWKKLQNLITARRYGSSTTMLTWGPNLEAEWLNTLADFRVQWGEVLSEEATAKREREAIGSAPIPVNQERYANVISRAEASKITAKERYLALLDFYSGKESNINQDKANQDAMTTSGYRTDISKANREYTIESRHANAEATNETNEVERDSNNEYKTREGEMINEIRLLEVELAKALFDLKKEYSVSGDGASVKHFLNRGGPIGYPSDASRGKDTISAMLTPGEYVISEPAVKAFGVNFFDDLNKMKWPRMNFNTGGLVSENALSTPSESVRDNYLGRLDLGIGDKKYPVKMDNNVARDFMKQLKKMNLSMGGS